jgi:hypothetical protein
LAVSSRIDPIGKDFLLEFADELEPAGRSAALAAFARQQLKDAQEVNRAFAGYIPKHDTFVDSVKDAIEESVRPDGTIVYQFHLITEAIEWIEQMLLQASPYKTGKYRHSHILFAGEAEVQFGAEVPDAETYTFLNTQPYSRKIENGLSRPAPEGVFQSVAVLASRRFGNLASIKYTFQSVSGGNTDLERWASRTRQVRKVAPRTTDEWNRRQPAIVVTVR